MSEEDIKILEIATGKREGLHVYQNQLKEAVENILLDYKQQLKENEANKKRIEELLNSKVGVDLNFDNCIPKAKVEEKIRSLDIKITYIENQYTNDGQNCNSEYLSLLYQKQILEELLKDGGE